MRPVTSWIVLKFGGTSVSSLANWRNIAHILRQRRATGARVLVVHSALTGMTDRLEMLLDPRYAHATHPMLAAIEERHRELAAELAIPVSAELVREFAELRRMAADVAL